MPKRSQQVARGIETVGRPPRIGKLLDHRPTRKEIVTATRTPTDVVERMYAETWEAFSKGARITDYVTVARRVREDLRNRGHNAH